MEALKKTIWESTLVESHANMARQSAYADGNDILSDIFNVYSPMDLISAGATHDQIGAHSKGLGENINERFQRIQRKC